LLKDILISNVTVSGDTRFDRVWENAEQPRRLPQISEFRNEQKVFIAGSTWPADEQLVRSLVSRYPNWKFIIASHEIDEEKIKKLIEILPVNSAITYSQLTPDSYWDHNLSIATYQTLIIDNIGMLSSLYQYGDIAYIGGGFGAGIHNTLEAAAFGLPVIFGPNYSKFKEARDLIALKAGFTISDEPALEEITDALITDEAFYNNASEKIKNYVKQNTGATKTIVDYIVKVDRADFVN